MNTERNLNQLKDEAQETATQAWNNLRSEAEDARERLSESLSSWSGRASSFVKARPGACLVGAFALGFLLAKVARHA
jgi:hypothetical protein